MPLPKKTDVPRKNPPYDESALQCCLREISTRLMSIKAASTKYGIPRSTIRYRMSGKWCKTTKRGPQTVLSKEEETDIVAWLIGMQKRGFPVQRRTLLFKIKAILTEFPRETPFKQNCPGRTWFASFMARHPRLAMRTPESVTSASARVSEADIRKWFLDISSWFDTEGMTNILSDPSRVFNGDETSFYLHPKTRAVLAEKGSRNVYEVEHADGKQNVTVMFSFSAAGQVIHPLVILPGHRIRKEIAQAFPPTWGLGQSERGWMTTHNFSEYIRQIFHPFLLKHGIQLPVVFFVDGHSSHVALEVADQCQELGIILIALYPNTTRITQPADVSIFKPLKDQWRKQLDDWRLEHPGEIFTVKQFGPTLKKAVDEGIEKDSIINGFRVCGLHPFDADNVDYSKCLAVNDSSPSPARSPGPSNDTNEHHSEGFTNLTENELSPKSTSQPTLPELSHSSSEPVDLPQPVMETSGIEQLLRTPSSSNITFSLSSFVSIHTDKIEQALKLIGPSTTLKILNRTDAELTHEEKIIRFFFKEFLQPFVKIHSQPLDHTEEIGETLCQSEEDTRLLGSAIDANSRWIDESRFEDGSALVEAACAPSGTDDTIIAEFTVSSRGSVSMDTQLPHDYTEEQVMQMLGESIKQSSSQTLKMKCETTSGIFENGPTMNQPQIQVFQDVTNKNEMSRKASLSDLLKLPPAPHRNSKHRNYTKKFYPVLTAGDRLEEIRRVENERQEEEQKKKKRISDRKEVKFKQAELKQRKDEERKKKKTEAELRKSEKKDCEKVLKRKAGNQREVDRKQQGKLKKMLKTTECSVVKEQKEN